MLNPHIKVLSVFCKVKSFCEGSKDVENVEVEGGNNVSGSTDKLSECRYITCLCGCEEDYVWEDMGGI